MKKILLLASAGLLLCGKTPAFAASSTAWFTSPQCMDILSLDPVSPYVQKVLERADTGLSNAAAATVDTDFRLYGWAGNVGAAWAGLIDTKVRQVVQSDDLVNNTACLRVDMAAIECKMDQVRHEMNAQLENGSFIALIQLTALLEFLNERYTALATGALDTTYRDTKWNLQTNFDNAGTPFKDDVMCPYSSDYGPPLLNGYGCDLTVLGSRQSFPPLLQEYNALKMISDELEAYRTSAAQFLGVQKSIDELFGTPSASPPPPTPRSHLTATGCKWTGGLCEQDSTLRCMTDKDCGTGNSCGFPNKVCKANPNQSCFDDSSCMTAGGNTGPCVKRDGKTPAKTELRGPFSLQKKQLELLMDFLQSRISGGNSRVYKDDLKVAPEFSASQSSESTARANDPFIYIAPRSDTRALNATWSRIQGKGEGIIFPVASDPALEIANSLSSLRKAIGDLARLTELKEGKDDTIRAFVVKYASFLLRSCMFRPCNASLAQILKITFADECFPYTDGKFLSDTASDPRSKKCADAAKITVP